MTYIMDANAIMEAQVKAEKEIIRLRDALMGAYTHCLVGRMDAGEINGVPYFPPDYEAWHNEVREMMRKALMQQPDVPEDTP